MKIRKISSFTGKVHEWDLPVTQNQFDRYKMGNLIQDVFNNLTAEQREFLMTGVTPDEWNHEFKPKTWHDMSEKLREGDEIEMLVDLDFGRVLAKGRIYKVVENNLNEMQACVGVVGKDKVWALIPGPANPDSPAWDDQAYFKVILKKRDAELGITTVD